MRWYKKLFKGKHGETWALWIDLRVLYKNYPELCEFDVSVRTRGDHPGFYFRTSLRPIMFEFEITSSRHEDGSHIWEHEDEEEASESV